MRHPQSAIRRDVMEAVLEKLGAAVQGQWDNASYAQGAAGHLLAVSILAERCPGRRPDLDLMEDGVQRLLAALPTLPHGLYLGAQGTLFAALELDRHYGFGLAADAARDLDDYLEDCLHTGQDLPAHFDLISGISGLLVYAAYRARSESGSALLDAAMGRLGAMATRDHRGACWFTPPAWIHGMPMGQAYPLGCIDLGLAHGQAGVLGALACAVAATPVPHTAAQSLLTESLAFIRRQEQTGGASHFGVVAGEREPARCAWCYGDLGTAGAVRLAAAALASRELDAWADRMLHSLRKRAPGTLGFVDPWLCHGSIGAGWLLRQHGAAYDELADAWQELHLHRGAGGVVDLLDGDTDLSLLEGLAGVALACAHGTGAGHGVHWSLPLLAGRDALRG